MKQKQMIFGAVLSVFILVSTPVLANTFQAESTSPIKETLITDKIEPKEVIFQTIIDIGKNKDIQNLIENSKFEIGSNKEKSALLFTKLFMKNPKLLFFMLTKRPVLSKSYLNYVYNLGLEIKSILGISELKSIASCIKINKPEIQEEFLKIVEENNELRSKMDEIAFLNCDCYNWGDMKSNDWNFPVICLILGIMIFIGFFIFATTGAGGDFIVLLVNIGDAFNCGWG